jgi:pimeloyl-ACP methyl ester carboxylesterase
MAEIRERTVATNGIEMRVTEAGDGPLVVLCHGFPELAYSWRHQLPALAAAGFHAVAPDQRGYGGTTQPKPIEDYDILHLGDDILGLLDALGEEQAVLVGHDWGAPVVWHLALRAPERVRAVVGMSVPFLPRGPMPPIQLMKAAFGEAFFYMLYFQQPGVADAELGADPARMMRTFMWTIGGESSPGDYKAAPAAGTGLLDVLSEPKHAPAWITDEEMSVFIEAFERTGFTGGLNWYRNLDRNWEKTEFLEGAKVEMPALFVAGEKDPVLIMAPPAVMEGWVTDLRGMVLIPDAGHWVQQEKPNEVNAALLDFLKTLD